MTEGVQTTRPARLARILPLLACPACRAPLRQGRPHILECTSCAASYPVRDGVPILLPAAMQEPGVGSADTDDPVSRHPYSPEALDIIARHSDGWVLDLGAGGKLHSADNVLQVDIFRYPMTDVVATADCLPFKDNAFSAVISQAVFEHLQYPEAAAGEIRRVLQPHGTLRIDTAFLQPEHGYPHHFYNATETGLRHWFREFDIEWSGVASYQHPKWALSWFLSVYLDRLDKRQSAIAQDASLGRVRVALEMLAAGSARAEDAVLLEALDALPAHELRTLAAGVSVQGRNPAKLADPGVMGVGASSPASSSGSMADVRQIEVARQEIAILREQLQALHEARTIAVDRGNYLSQVAYFNVDVRLQPSLALRTRVSFALKALVRLLLPPRLWLELRARMHRWRSAKPATSPGGVPPFFSIIVAPDDAASFIETFFSLTHQSYTGWELIVIEHSGHSVTVSNVLQDFLQLDRRVRRLPSHSTDSRERLRQAQAAARGQYFINLPENATLAQRALQTIYTLLRARPGTPVVLADFERGSRHEQGLAMRCHCMPADGQVAGDPAEFSFAVHAVPSAVQDARRQEVKGAYIGEVLFGQMVHPPLLLS